MIEELIDARYTVVRAVLENQLAAWFGADNFKIIVQFPFDLKYCTYSHIDRSLQTTMLDGGLRYQGA